MPEEITMPEMSKLIETTYGVLKDYRRRTYQELNEEVYKRLNLSKKVREVPAKGYTYCTYEIERLLATARQFLKNALLIYIPESGSWELTDVAYDISSVDGEKIISSGNKYLDVLREEETLKRKDYQALFTDALKACRVDLADGRCFELLIRDLLRRMGFWNISLTPYQHDGGVDLYAQYGNELMGVSNVVVQCKFWTTFNDGYVRAQDIRDFIKVVEKEQANYGIFFATCNFGQMATGIADAQDGRIVLVDGEHLIELLTEYEVGFSRAEDYVINRDYLYYLKAMCERASK